MSKDALDRTELPLEAQKKLQECVAVLAACGLSEEGPPLETTRTHMRNCPSVFATAST